MKRRPANYVKKTSNFLRDVNFSFSFVGLSIRSNTRVQIRHSTEQVRKSACKKSAKQTSSCKKSIFLTLGLLILISLILFWALDGFYLWYVASPFALHLGMSLSKEQLLLIADKALDIFLAAFGRK